MNKTYPSTQYNPTPRNAGLGNPFPHLAALPADEGDAAFADALEALAWSVAEKRASRDARALDLRYELQREAESAAGEAVAVMITRFAHIAPNLFAALTRRIVRYVGEGKHPTLAFPLPVWRAAHKAWGRALRKMARSHALELRTFDATGWAGFSNPDNAEEVRLAEGAACAQIRAKACELIAAIRERAATGDGNARRAALAHLRRVEAWRDRAIALVRGDNSAPPIAALSHTAEAVREVSESLTVVRKGRFVAHDGRGGVSGKRMRKDRSGHALFARGWRDARLVANFLGSPLHCLFPGFKHS